MEHYRGLVLTMTTRTDPFILVLSTTSGLVVCLYKTKLHKSGLPEKFQRETVAVVTQILT